MACCLPATPRLITLLTPNAMGSAFIRSEASMFRNFGSVRFSSCTAEVVIRGRCVFASRVGSTGGQHRWETEGKVDCALGTEGKVDCALGTEALGNIQHYFRHGAHSTRGGLCPTTSHSFSIVGLVR